MAGTKTGARIINRIIAEKGIKKYVIAERLGITPQKFSDMLNNRRAIYFDDIPKICDALEISPNELFSRMKSA